MANQPLQGDRVDFDHTDHPLSTPSRASSRFSPQSSTDDPFETLRLRGGDGSRGFAGEEDENEDEDEDEGEDEEGPPPPRRRRAAAAHANVMTRNEFQPGAIVRVKLQNFVTYEKAEFSLGPNLNMVIGPNGTGKSSLVCAICLGLGYPSSILGRASAFGEFVKHGKDEAEIEIELQRKPSHAQNYIVGLCIKREDNSRKFTLNGSRTTLKDIQNLMRSLRIQIDNLCQFLPQDKVAEFAGLSPVELLDKTLLAAAPPEMSKWQSELKENFRDQKEAQRSAEQSSEQLRKMEARQNVLQADVEKLQERREIQETIAKLEKVCLMARYHTARGRYRALKVRKRAAEEELKALQESSAPSLQAVNQKQEYHSQIQAVVDYRKGALRNAEAAADEALGLIDAAESRSQELSTNIEAEKSTFAVKKQELGKIRKKITDMGAMYKQAPRPFDGADWNRRIREQDHLGRDKKQEADRVGEEADRLYALGKERSREKTRVMQNIEALKSAQGLLEVQLRKISSDAAKGWEWLKENQNQFEKEVFGPPMLSCSVSDRRFSQLVQSQLGHNDFLCFTAQTKNDHKKLSDQFYNRMRITVTIRTCLTSYNSFQPPLPNAELRALGFDGYVTDFLEGPEPVLAMLCAEKRVHQSAVGLRQLSDEQFDRVQEGEKITHFACGNKLHRIIRRREYGPTAVTTKTTPIQQGRFWTDQPIDAAEKAELDRKLRELLEEVSQCTAQWRQATARHAELVEEQETINARTKQLQTEKSELQRDFNKWTTLPDKIESEKRTLRQKAAELDEARARVRGLEEQRSQVVLDKAKAILGHQKKIAGIRAAYQALVEVQLLLIEAKSGVTVLKEKSVAIVQRLEEANHNIGIVNRQLEETRKEAASALEAVEPYMGPEKAELLQLAAGREPEDIEGDMRAEQAKLEVIQANNPQALEEFENWARRIDTERANHEVQETRLADLSAKIERVKSQWEPRLDELVGEINGAFGHNFEQISCAGEVGVHKDEDFDKWAIEIRVRFRQGETLQRLDQHRQSGGERAVSTIFYLMSLQSMAQAPFRVVDEINQGMDPRNERMVHERMVEIACREHTSQYFLITPKLLSGLRYDERMRVHTIVSGEHVDGEGTENMNFAMFAKIQRRVMGH
ncbi:SMC5-like protein [Lasiosphaeria hispida]|uniref:Structural maintenance of chromosomes protein 5 n=1 Tax=Lasiosphaeria hispida TaxID=260671 RepID=A0AAJ0HVN0_9PEZI|nr:SMC5-like protein [Lasiosphaeria hispida]